MTLIALSGMLAATVAVISVGRHGRGRRWYYLDHAQRLSAVSALQFERDKPRQQRRWI
jgi:hypothetical protein